MGKHTVFSALEEKELKNNVLLLEKLYFGVTFQIRRIAFDYAKKITS